MRDCKRCEAKRAMLRVLSVPRSVIAMCWECEVFDLLRLCSARITEQDKRLAELEAFRKLAEWRGKSDSGRDVYFPGQRTLGDYGCSAADQSWPWEPGCGAIPPTRKRISGEGATPESAAADLWAKLERLP